jgi:L-cysteine/cystine lyase
MTFEEARAMFPVLERLAYLNTGSFGPLSSGTATAIAEEGQRDLADGRSGVAYFERGLALRDELRGLVAELVTAPAENVALTASTTDGCNIVLSGLGLQPEDEVITTTDEHFGLLGPLHASGARIVVVEPTAESILSAVSPRTRLLAVSQVLWTNGRVLPVHELREASRLPILVDAAQSVGAIPVDVRGLDFVAIPGQKWLCGPDPTGALVVADPDALRITRPSSFSFSKDGFDADGAFVPRPGAARFEPNWISVTTLAGLKVALAQAPEWRFERATAQTNRLRAMLALHVEVVSSPEQATLVAFHPPAGQTAAELTSSLMDLGVVVREIPRRELVRASVGWWTSDDDLERLVTGLA